MGARDRALGTGVLGVLLNEPYSLDPADGLYLRAGAEVPFLPEHVVDINEPPDEYVKEWLAKRPSRRWPPLPTAASKPEGVNAAESTPH